MPYLTAARCAMGLLKFASLFYPTKSDIPLPPWLLKEI